MANHCRNIIKITLKDKLDESAGELFLKEFCEKIATEGFLSLVDEDWNNRTNSEKLEMFGSDGVYSSTGYRIKESEITKKERNIEFHITSRWSPFVGFVKKLTEKYPELIVGNIKYYEPGVIFAGEETFDAGEQIFSYKTFNEVEELLIFGLKNGFECIDYVDDAYYDTHPELVERLRAYG